MPDDLATLGVEAEDVQPESTGRNVAIGTVGLVLVIAGLVPLAIGAIWVGSYVWAAMASLVMGGPAPQSGL
ncbi:MAG TPA: hypothetical protein VF000_12250 [Agromyces sp.]|jgi:hypothetical protein